MRLSLRLLLLLTPVSCTFATTWDEPWHDRVLAEADVFLLANVLHVDEGSGCALQVIETLAGPSAPERIELDHFFLLDLCSSSGGHGPEFHLQEGARYYLLLKRNAEGSYGLPTPTSGAARLENNEVYATYRHSYHQALVPDSIYRWTMTAMFQHAHGRAVDTERARQFILAQLSLPPAHVQNEQEAATFFQQHVALELMYAIPTEISAELIAPFALDTANYHGMISAARALGSLKARSASELLLKMVAAKDLPGFPKVMAVRSIARAGDPEMLARLSEMETVVVDEEVGFGGNIMDPRVCTSLPSVRAAIRAATGKR